jgi:hypothetical protein
LQISTSKVVLPALGGATMRQRCPLPKGVIRSSTRGVMLPSVRERFQRSYGSTLVV